MVVTKGRPAAVQLITGGCHRFISLRGSVSLEKSIASDGRKCGALLARITGESIVVKSTLVRVDI